jgi:hypothetical protein
LPVHLSYSYLLIHLGSLPVFRWGSCINEIMLKINGNMNMNSTIASWCQCYDTPECQPL